MFTSKSKISAAVAAIALAGGLSAVQAAPLANGSTMGIDAGNGGGTGPCTAGSCFSMEIFTGTFAWADVAPGNDGGIVIGKVQASGGQELTPPGESLPDSGDMTAAWSFFKAWGTFFGDMSQSTFSDTSNDGTTALGDFNVAWNGSVIPMGAGTVNDYTVSVDGTGAGSWSIDYSQIVCCGNFTGVPFRMFLVGSVTPPPDTNVAPVVSDVSIDGFSGEPISWTPSFTDADLPEDSHTCEIVANASDGNATVNADCSGGTYTSGAALDGTDSFTYRVTDAGGLSGDGVVTATVTPRPVIKPCADVTPVSEVMTIGGGQSPTVNGTLTVTFTGKITTTTGLQTGGKNSVKICGGTTVDFVTNSATGSDLCTINGVAVATTGTLAIGDKLICTNKPDGSDTDRFSVKNGGA